MKSMLKSLVIVIPVIFASYGSQAMAAGEDLKQKTFNCSAGSKKIIAVSGGQRAEIFEILISSSTATQVEVAVGSDTVLESFMQDNDNVQTNLNGFLGKAGKNLKVKCTGIDQLAVTVLFNLISLP
jgi:hypothetical protein